MATILVVPYIHDRFKSSHYLLKALFPHWARLGHQVLIRSDLDHLPNADVAVLHLDRTVVPDRYAAAVARFPVVINARARDLSKRTVSTNLLAPQDTWDGRVIVKTDLNSHGNSEAMHLHHEGVEPRPTTLARYAIFDNLRLVPGHVWLDPSLVVERFLPEPDPDGYALRVWTFLGDRERCTRYVGREPIVKAADFVSRVPCEVPDVIRAERKRLGFDYGKFDFVVHDGRAVLLDANSTPTLPSSVSPMLASSNAELAVGMSGFVRAAQRGDNTNDGQRSASW